MGLLPLPEAGPDVPAVDPRSQTVAVSMEGPASPELDAIPCGPCAQDPLASNQLDVVIGRALDGESVEMGRGGDALSRDGAGQPACRGDRQRAFRGVRGLVECGDCVFVRLPDSKSLVQERRL